jgi:3-hydroxybutyryl-CoA dehydrogenase
MTARAAIACLGAGRMGRGLAVTFAYAGHDVAIIDFRERTADDTDRYRTQVQNEVDAQRWRV